MNTSLASNSFPTERIVPPYWVADAAIRRNEMGVLNIRAIWPEDPRYGLQGKLNAFSTNPNVAFEAPFDLKNLLFFRPEDVQRTTEEIESATKSGDFDHIILFLSAGGTIAMSFNDQSKQVPTLDVQALVREISPSKLTKVKLVGSNFPQLFDSADAHPMLTGEIVQFLGCIYSQLTPAARLIFTGVALAYGTDTLAGSGAEIAFGLTADCPFNVGMIAAQRSTARRRNDVADNINAAVVSLIEFKERRQSALFAVAGGGAGSDIIPLVAAVKQTDQRVDIFSSVIPPILRGANFGAEGIHLPNIYRRPDLFSPIVNRNSNCVMSFEPRMGDDPKLYAALLRALCESDSRPRAVNLITFGSFTAHYSIQKVFEKEARDKGVIVFASNSVVGGILHDYEAGVSEAKNGFHLVHMSPSALMAKANLANLAYPDEGRFLHFIKNHNFIGEIRPDFSTQVTQAGGDNCDLNTGVPDDFYRRSDVLKV